MDSALLCPSCDYNLTGFIENRCPECGFEFSRDDLCRVAVTWPKPIAIGTVILEVGCTPVLWTLMAAFLVSTHAICLAWLGWVSIFALSIYVSIRVSRRLLAKQWRRVFVDQKRRQLIVLNVVLAIVLFIIQAVMAVIGADIVVSTYYARGGRLPFDH